MKIKYIGVLAGLLAFVACNDPEDVDLTPEVVVEEMPELTTGDADFSTYVAVGNSLTAGFADGALFKASQELSMPSMLAAKFEAIGGGSFTQPLMNDNYGGVAIGGNRILEPRLVFFRGDEEQDAGPVPLESIIGEVTVSTDLALNNPTGPFSNMGVPGAKSFHLLAPGYGNLSNVALGLANPYFVRMTGDTPDASVLELAAGQAPTFFSLWIGNNDVLGYATTGGDETNPLTPVSGVPGVGFDGTYEAIVTILTANGAKGVVANIPDVTSIPHFTTVPHNPLDPTNENFGPLIPNLNGIFGQLNQVYAFLESQGVPNATDRQIEFAADAASEVIVKDETLTDLSAQIAGVLAASPTFPAFVESFGLPAQAAPLVAGLLGNIYGQTREANSEDLFVLPASAVIGTVNADAVAGLMAQGLSQELAGQFSVEGITLPLADKWVLVPSEQEEIAERTAAFNAIIKSTAETAGLAFVDANNLMNRLANGGITSGEFTLTANLVTGSAFSLDGVHPTSRGYALLANEFMKAIDATYSTNFEASGNLVNVGNYPTNFSPQLP